MSRRILILGGTGAMGTHLIKILAERGYHISVTSRKRYESYENVTFVKGDAKDDDFLRSLLSNQWDVIVDFMAYSTKEFAKRRDILLSNTAQYVFISSARVYADTESLITEDSPRLLDVSMDDEYLKTDEYALAKARQENALRASGKTNWTIIRPSLTYDKQRLQLGVLEKENWLYRAIKGRTIVFSKDLLNKFYTMSTGYDVAKGIAAVIGNGQAFGESYHITAGKSYQWNEILQVYLEAIEEKRGIEPDVFFTEKSLNLKFNDAKYQVIYGRYFNRSFDNTKIGQFVDVESFKDPKYGLRECIIEFLENPVFRNINWKLEALNDKAAGERTPLSEIHSLKNRVAYLMYRYNFHVLYNVLKKFKNLLRNS